MFYKWFLQKNKEPMEKYPKRYVVSQMVEYLKQFYGYDYSSAVGLLKPEDAIIMFNAKIEELEAKL